MYGITKFIFQENNCGFYVDNELPYLNKKGVKNFKKKLVKGQIRKK
jgi:hypothetical protein